MKYRTRSFEKIISDSPFIMTEGALAERLKSEFKVPIDPFINHAGLIYTHPKLFEKLYRQYIEIAMVFDIPIMIMTPTRKVNMDSLNKSAFSDKELIHDSCQLLNNIKSKYEHFLDNILIGGHLGCKGDAYSDKDALNSHESYSFHKKQTEQFSQENIDFLFAGIMSEINETIGMARAMAETKLPYIISFMIRKNGCLIDGTPISEAIKIIDASVKPKPLFYMANCIHPANLRLALAHDNNRNRCEMERFKGIQANASSLSPEELNSCGLLHQEDFDKMIEEMQVLHNHFNLKVFGGCCGTNNLFMYKLSSNLIINN